MRKNNIMKKIVISSLVMTLVMSFVACGDEKKENETNKNSTNEQESKTEEYAKKIENIVNYDCLYKMSDEKCKSMLWYNYEDGKETSHSTTLYNAEGLMYSYCNVDGSITHGWEAVELDEKGNAKSVRKYEYKDDEVVYDYVSEEYEYEYNDKGLIVKEIIKKEIDGEDTEILEYAYDENDNVTKYTWTKGNIVYVTNYEYDDNNNCVKETQINEYGEENTITYKYDSNGNLLENEKVRYEYDENGRIAKKTDWDGYTYVNKYDSYGNLVKESVYAPNSTDVEYIVKHEYMGTETDFTVTVKDGSIDGYIVYTYKEAKLVAEETYDNDELIQKIQYEY